MLASTKSSSSLQPLKRKRLPVEISLRLRDAIYSGEYKPGDKFPSESQLGEIFQVGRPVVREALRILENSGLLFVRPGSGGGAFVKKISSKILSDAFEGIIRLDRVSMEELTEARLAVEMAILPLVISGIKPEDVKALGKNIEEAEESLEKGVEEPKNLQFHVLLAKASHNQLLIKITEGLFRILTDMLQRYEYSYERKKLVLKEHKNLLRLLKTKRYEELELALAEHIRNTYRHFQ